MFLQIVALVMLLTILFMVGYSLLFDIMYQSVTKNKIFNLYEQVKTYEIDDYEKTQELVKAFDKGFKVDVIIQAQDEVFIYQTDDYIFNVTYFDEVNLQDMYISRMSDFYQRNKVDKISEHAEFVWAKDMLLDVDTLNIVGQLENGDEFIIRAMLLPSSINILAATRLAPIIGLVLLLVGIIVAFFLADGFTKPILSMLFVTEKMAELSFEESCEVTSQDEFGQLAGKINTLSAKLDEAINSLQEKNDLLEEGINERINIDNKRKQLLRNVSHELKTPLTLLRTYSEGLKLNIASEMGKTEYYCDVILDETMKMDQLVNNLLDINRLQFGDKSTNKEVFSLKEGLNKVAYTFAEKCLAQGIAYTIEEFDDLEVLADRAQFELVLVNYLSNAIKYVDDRKIIKVTVSITNEAARIEVYNSFGEIEEEELVKIWDEFYTIDESRSQRENSHGLGLAFVKAIQECEGSDYGVRTVSGGIVFYCDVKRHIS